MKLKLVVAIVIAASAYSASAREPSTAQVPNPAFDARSLGLRPSYQACLDAVDAPGATFPMLDCNAAESEYQDQRLNAVYRKLIAALPPAHVVLLRREERAWLETMHALCGSLWDEGDTGTGQAGRLVASSCEMEETALRAALLEQRLAEARWKEVFEND